MDEPAVTVLLVDRPFTTQLPPKNKPKAAERYAKVDGHAELREQTPGLRTGPVPS